MPSFIDLSGKKIGRFMVIKRVLKRPGVWWKCKCRCGVVKTLRANELLSGNTRSCGCLARERASTFCKKRIKEIEPGTRFGILVVIRRSRKKLYAHGVYWLCRCGCGNLIVCWGSRLRSGKHTHCGCRTSEIISEGRRTHGFSRTHVYRTLKRMIQRCYNPNSDQYFRYGGRGIKVYKTWRDHPEKFVIWALANGYRRGLTIDRIDNNKSYSPKNCRWIGCIPQARNRRDNHPLTWHGQTKTIVEWSEITGIKYHTISKRIIKYKWSVDEALTLPPDRNKWRRLGKAA